MEKSKKILFTTDFSAPAANAFRYALLLADRLKANIQVLHVVFPEAEPLDFPVLVAQATQLRLETAREQLVHFIAKNQEQLEGQLKNQPAITSNIELGTPAKVISDTAKREEADIIIMGTRGQKNAFEKMMGSVAAAVVKNAHCAVIVVPEGAQFRLEKIAYASDLDDADPFRTWKMTRLLKMENPTIRFIHFNPGDEITGAPKMAEIEDFFSDLSPKLNIHFQNLPGDDVVENLNDFIQEHEIQMLAMYQPQRSFFDKLLHHSATKEMALNSKVPLLVLKST